MTTQKIKLLNLYLNSIEFDVLLQARKAYWLSRWMASGW